MRILVLGIVLASQAAWAAELEGFEAWEEEPVKVPEAAYVDPGFQPPPPPPEHHHYHPTLKEVPKAERNAESLDLSVPLHARRGLTATLSLRYRKVSGEAIVRMSFSPGLQLEHASLPPVQGSDGELLWFGLDGPMGSLKIKARIQPDVPVGTALLIHADLIDGYGNVEQQTETIVVR
jgi:hypothetical protein